MHITSIAFDQYGRRLLVGSHEGDAVRIYNFSNGKLLGECVNEGPNTHAAPSDQSSQARNSSNSIYTSTVSKNLQQHRKRSSSVGNESHSVINLLSAQARRASTNAHPKAHGDEKK